MSWGHGIGIWKFIVEGKEEFWKFTWFKLGSGVKIKFWDDVWCKDRHLRVPFSRIYCLALEYRGSIYCHYDIINGGPIIWCPKLRRSLNDWELEWFVWPNPLGGIHSPNGSLACWNSFEGSFFLWSAILDETLALNYLKSRGWCLANKCVMCLQEEKTVDDLLVHCPMACNVCFLFIFLLHLGMAWVFPSDFKDLWMGNNGH